MTTSNRLRSNWPAQPTIHAFTTMRLLGVSTGNFASNNLALHVHDKEDYVLANRKQLADSLPAQPQWLEQTHSNNCVIIEQSTQRTVDASITRQPKTVLAILTADCLPILLCNKQGDEIAAIHAGWKGLRNGIIENTLKKMNSNPQDILAWIGPSICGHCYEVGKEIKENFLSAYAFCSLAFEEKNDKFMFNLAYMAELILNHGGVNAIYPSSVCTYELNNLFYSYRRAPETGRMASLIWFD